MMRRGPRPEVPAEWDNFPAATGVADLGPIYRGTR